MSRRYKMLALITIVNKPRVRMIIGLRISFRRGRRSKLRAVKIPATARILAKVPEIWNPAIKFAATKRAIRLEIKAKIILEKKRIHYIIDYIMFSKNDFFRIFL